MLENNVYHICLGELTVSQNSVLQISVVYKPETRYQLPGIFDWHWQLVFKMLIISIIFST